VLLLDSNKAAWGVHVSLATVLPKGEFKFNSPVCASPFSVKAPYNDCGVSDAIRSDNLPW
jgi:hypothetical protein